MGDASASNRVRCPFGALTLLLLAFLLHMPDTWFFEVSNARQQQFRLTSPVCQATKGGAVVINAMLTAREEVFEWNLAAWRRFYDSATVDIIIVNNGGSESETLIQQAIANAGLEPKSVFLIQNAEAADGYGYEFGAVRAASRSMGWLAGCMPYEYVIVMQTTMALLQPLDLSPLAHGHFKRFLHFEFNYDTRDQQQWVAEQLHNIGLHEADSAKPQVPGAGQFSKPCKGVFGPAWIMSNACASQLLSRGAFEVPRVSLKWHQTGSERLLAHLVAAFCDISCDDASLDGDIWHYPSPFQKFDPNVSIASLLPRFILKKWGSHQV